MSGLRKSVGAGLFLVVVGCGMALAACGVSATGGPECTVFSKTAPCASDQLCVDYKADNGSGTQCATTSCDDCACALKEQCQNPTEATCTEVDGGLHLSNCFFAP